MLGVFAIAFAYGCTAKKVVTPAPTTEENAPTVVASEKPANEKLVVTTEVLAEGKNLYGTNCAKCHELYDAKSFTAEEWTPIVIRMQKKARISDEQREKIYAYLTTPQM